MKNSGLGSKKLCLGGGGANFTCWDWQQFVGRFGLLETKSALRIRKIKNPSEVIYTACVLMQYWSGLYPGDAEEMIETSVQAMIKAAIQILEKKQRAQGARLMLTAGNADHDEEEEQKDPEPSKK
jgi:hypothetical protein